ncbi:sec-independent protein translocase protein TatB [Cereibacter ovatus]|uniref:Sec-independent protein translocase protein TatB n=1 Tax=Cereibacter ovatus TaxID=439529 RepID=A0A285CUH7_9RHOB|nr:Sec-independent protein translocase protein TatB [Cereibacter ovatus]SNX71221.1 sec-independent protein translocase protein TatB [Cereibacter ovatus]
MLDIGWSELLVIGVVALIVVGPKDLPEMFRTLGRMTAKARNMAREFQRAMEAAADETGVKDVAKDVQNITSPRSMGLEAVKQAAEKFEKWDPMKAPPTMPKGPVPPAAPSAAGAATVAAAADAVPASDPKSDA